MNIGLFCAAGMSTSILVERMKEAAQKKGKDATIAAYSISELEQRVGDIDVALFTKPIWGVTSSGIQFLLVKRRFCISTVKKN